MDMDHDADDQEFGGHEKAMSIVHNAIYVMWAIYILFLLYLMPFQYQLASIIFLIFVVYFYFYYIFIRITDLGYEQDAGDDEQVDAENVVINIDNNNHNYVQIF